jgi:isochorismate synthase
MSELTELTHNPRGPESSLNGKPIRIVTRVVEVGSPLSLFVHHPKENAFFVSTEGSDHAGFGEVEALSADGPLRFLQIRQAAEALFARLTWDESNGVPPPRLYGGFSFQPGAASSPPWRAFGDARFVLPRVRYVRSGRSAWLSLAMHPGESRRSAALGLEAAQAALARPLRTGPSVAVRATVQLGESQYRDQVQAAQAAIHAGQIVKVVLARSAQIIAEHPFEIEAVLNAIFAEPSTRFAFRVGGTTFVGATPERLVARMGGRVLTEALAGTIAIPSTSHTKDSETDAARALLASAKDREEHAIVVRHVEAVLAPFCTNLQVPKEPIARSLGHLLHLHTPIQGELRSHTHLLTLAEALHPTPAVGGAPTAPALSLIRELESVPRGWYAAPIGSFDHMGNGELHVALRSGILDGTSARIYSGGGILRDSDPAAEYAETALKQRVLRRALGL